MNLQEALKYAKNYLEAHNILDSQLDAWYLLEYVIKKDKTYFLLHQEEVLKEEDERLYIEYVRQRGEHIPLQHITKQQEFMGLLFQVNDKVLIPRQDTEILVEEVLKRMKPKSTVLDMCTGSGCIIISLKKERPDINAQASDVSYEALCVAKQNAKHNQVEIIFTQSDMFQNIKEKYDMIVSNPPYIATKVVGELMEEVRIHEPMIALDGGSDGLYFYREIIKSARDYLNPEGQLCFEIGYDQGEAVSLLMKDAGFENVTIIKDLAGLDRVVIGNT